MPSNSNIHQVTIPRREQKVLGWLACRSPKLEPRPKNETVADREGLNPEHESVVQWFDENSQVWRRATPMQSWEPIYRLFLLNLGNRRITRFSDRNR